MRPRGALLPAALLAAAALFLPASRSSPAAAPLPDLAIGPEDLRIEAREDGGYDLFVRKKPQLSSVLLVETTKDPAMRADNFAYRARDWNPVNGDERRLLNGKPLPASSRLYSLISSTARPDAQFGQAFRILIPPVLVYGYAWSRSGTVSVGKGTFINIRAFQKPYGDYSGPFLDNPYEITVTAKEPPPPPPPPPPPEPAALPPPPPGDYSPETAKAFAAVAEATEGETVYVPDDGSTSARVAEVLDRQKGRSLDLVVCFDTTASMDPYLADVKKNLEPAIREQVARFESYRLGLVLFKDYYPDEYITRKLPWMTDVGRFAGYIRGITAYGGGDIPEAVHEALYEAATGFDWKAEVRLIILVGDAPPHPVPRGKITFRDVVAAATAQGIRIDALVEPIKVKGNN